MQFVASLAYRDGNWWSGLWAVLRHQIFIPLALPAALVVLALVLRFGRTLWFRFKQQGFPPIVIHAADDFNSRAFAAKLSEYLAQEAPGPAVIIPPGSGAPPPPVPVEELSSRGGWLAAFSRIVVSREPAFDVHVECPKFAPIGMFSSPYWAAFRVTRFPGNRVLAADRLSDKDEGRLVDAIGCLIIHSVRQQPAILRHTPRWERWSPEINGYAAYRRALDYERRGEQAAALKEYGQALRYEPGNFLISIRKAALLEVMHEADEAPKVYRTCNELWPEHIETAYRLAASYANNKDHKLAEDVLRNIRRRLRLRVLRKERRKTWQLTHWNVGERRYWRSWFDRQPPIFGPSNRYLLLKAVRVAEQVRGIGRIASPSPSALAHDSMTEVTSQQAKPDSPELVQKKVRKLLRKMAKLTTRRSIARPHIRLFHPALPIWERWRRNHDESWHNKIEDDDLVIYPPTLSRLPRLLRPRKRIGWLAHYNAACFYSLAMKLEAKWLPAKFTLADWKVDCARAAIRELGHVRRDPLSQIEPEWYRNDPELQELRNHCKGSRWAEFVGI